MNFGVVSMAQVKWGWMRVHDMQKHDAVKLYCDMWKFLFPRTVQTDCVRSRSEHNKKKPPSKVIGRFAFCLPIVVFLSATIYMGWQHSISRAGDDVIASSMVLTNAISDVCGGDAGLHLIVLWKCTL